VDLREISKFEALAARWWDTGGQLGALHAINPLRVAYIVGRCQLTGQRVLDVGCGGGILAEALAARGARVTGIDMGEGPLSAARQHLQGTGLAVEYRRTTPEALAASEAGGYDRVTCMELLEHVPQPDSVVAACGTLVKPGGDVFFATINRNPKAFLLAIAGAEYLLGLLARGTHTYAGFVKPAELRRWARQAGLACRDITGMHYNPITRRYKLGGNTHVNYFAHFRRN